MGLGIIQLKEMIDVVQLVGTIWAYFKMNSQTRTQGTQEERHRKNPTDMGRRYAEDFE
jgi:hypothetical protein